MRLLRKGEKCRLEATNYRPISLLSVFYKMASGVIKQRLETVMEGLIGRQQNAYSSERNICSVLKNLMNMMQLSKQRRMADLILCIDFKKATWKKKSSLSREYPQGDILSPYIFNICVEILLLKITQTDKLDGVKM